MTIAKVDATLNDVPDEVAGFPTIKLYPAGKKDTPVDYSGSRTVEDLAKFIAEHGTHKVDAQISDPSSDDKLDVDADGDASMKDIPETETMHKAAPAATTKPSNAAESAASEAAKSASESVESVEAESTKGAAARIVETVVSVAEAIIADDGAPPEHHDEL